jgi:hypothetical protein
MPVRKMIMVNRCDRKRVWLAWACIFLCLLATDIAAAARDVDNAALFYYQAFIRCPSYDGFPSEVVRDVFASAISVEDVKQFEPYVEKNQEILQLVEAGSRKRQCDWAIPPLQAVSFENFAAWRAKTILFLVGADARALAASGDYRRAFERVLTLRRFAVHLTHDPNLCLEAPLLIEANAVRLWAMSWMLCRRRKKC